MQSIFQFVRLVEDGCDDGVGLPEQLLPMRMYDRESCKQEEQQTEGTGVNMNRDDVVKELNHLIELDRSLVEAYDKVVEKMRGEGDQISADTMVTFREDHARHVRDLGSLITRYGGQVATGRGVEGILAKSVATIASLGGVNTILKGMRENEERSNDIYRKTLEKSFPEDVNPSLMKNLEDERRHLSWIEHRLSQQ